MGALMEDDWVHTFGPALTAPLVHGHGTLAVVSDAGEVEINWVNVAATAADPKSEKLAWQFAKLLLAARGA